MRGRLETSCGFGYKASAEQFAPRNLLDFSVAAEKIGLDTVAISDHFQPWRHHGGHAPYAPAGLGAIGQRTRRVALRTSTLTPTLRYHPAVVAQMFATLACMNPGRVFLGIGSGEAMNERPALGIDWPSYKERSQRLTEAVALMRRLWSEERVSFEGEFYQTVRATIYDRPETPIPIYLAASGPKAAHLVGRVADGFITTSGKRRDLYEELLGAVKQGAADAGRDFSEIDKHIEIKVSYDRDAQYAHEACNWWQRWPSLRKRKAGWRIRSNSSAWQTPTSVVPTPASSSPTIPWTSSRAWSTTWGWDSPTWCSMAPARTSTGSCSSSAPTFCRCCGSGSWMGGLFARLVIGWTTWPDCPREGGQPGPDAGRSGADRRRGPSRTRYPGLVREGTGISRRSRLSHRHGRDPPRRT